jgi:predicted nuclease of predicted toxin-antitoxin system
MEYARSNGYIVFTHDLDFGILLALTHNTGPSVIQVRSQNVTPEYLSETIVDVLFKHKSIIENGALVTVCKNKLRLRILPILISVCLQKES